MTSTRGHCSLNSPPLRGWWLRSSLKTSCSAYKGQAEDLVAASKKLAPGEEEEDNKVSLLKKGKTAARLSSKASTRAIPATRQTTIPTGAIIKETTDSLP